MPIPSSTTSFANIQNELGGTNPISLSEYYNISGKYGVGITGIPISGQISINNFRGKSKPVNVSISGTGNSINIVSDNSNFKYAFFSNNGTFTINGNLICDILIVGGGGAGTTQLGGGGGGGAVIYIQNATIISGSYNIVIGLGGQTSGTKGNNSSFAGIIAEGGGAGGRFDVNNNNGGSGGSGGGAGCDTDDGLPISLGGAKGILSTLNGFIGNIYGNNGGDGLSRSGGILGAGGGGGAGQVGGNGNINLNGQGGTGGNGIQINIDGRNLYWGGGGGGSSYFGGNNRGGNGGLGGGGGGSSGNGNGTIGTGGGSALNSGSNASLSSLNGGNGGANTGGGGGSGGWWNGYGWGDGGTGGSGVVIIRYSI